MANRIQLRTDTVANWASVNPVLAQGEFGVAIDNTTLKPTGFKVGDGVTAWATLEFFSTGGTGGTGDTVAPGVNNLTSGNIVVTLSEHADYPAFVPTGNLTFDLSGTGHVANKIKRYWVDGSGNNLTVSTIGAIKKSGSFLDTVGKRNEYIFESNAFGLVYYWIYTFDVPVTDTVDPIYNKNQISGIGVNQATYTVNFNEAANGYYFVSTSTTQPTETALQAGTGAVKSGVVTCLANIDKAVVISGLTLGTQYYVHTMGKDSAGNTTTIQPPINLLTLASDTVAPTSSSAEIGNVSANTLVLGFDESVNVTGVTGITLTSSASAITVTAVSGGSGTNLVRFTLSRNIVAGETLTYLIGATNNIKDTTGNSHAGFTPARAITNNVAVVANQAPTVNPTISGTTTIGSVLTVTPNYSDSESDAAGAHLYQWYRSDDTSGTNEAAISGATGTTYTLVTADGNKRIRVRVTPYALTGISPGLATYSSYTANIAFGGIQTYATLGGDYSSNNPFNADKSVQLGAVTLDPNKSFCIAMSASFTDGQGVLTIPLGSTVESNILALSDGRLRYRFRFSGDGSIIEPTTTTALPDGPTGLWRLVILYNATTKTIKMRLNGADEVTNFNAANAGTSALAVAHTIGGGASGGVGNRITGNVGKLYIFADRLLTTAEVTELEAALI